MLLSFIIVKAELKNMEDDVDSKVSIHESGKNNNVAMQSRDSRRSYHS